MNFQDFSKENFAELYYALDKSRKIAEGIAEGFKENFDRGYKRGLSYTNNKGEKSKFIHQSKNMFRDYAYLSRQIEKINELQVEIINQVI